MVAGAPTPLETQNLDRLPRFVTLTTRQLQTGPNYFPKEVSGNRLIEKRTGAGGRARFVVGRGRGLFWNGRLLKVRATRMSGEASAARSQAKAAIRRRPGPAAHAALVAELASHRDGRSNHPDEALTEVLNYLRDDGVADR